MRSDALYREPIEVRNALSVSLVSQKPEDLLCNLGAFIRPLLDFDFLDLIVPPLRDRREDLPILVRHYVDKYGRRMNRRIETIPSHAMEFIARYPWPGNLRELQNFIERAVILSPGSTLRAPLDELKEDTVDGPTSKVSILEEAEREHALKLSENPTGSLAVPTVQRRNSE